MEEMIRLHVSEEVHPVIDRTFQFEEAKAAVQYLMNESHLGKVLIKVGSDS